MPSLARTPEELTASNLALNTISGVGMFAGPAIAGVVLAFSGPSLVFALTAAAYVWSGFFVLGLSPDVPPEADRRERNPVRSCWPAFARSGPTDGCR